MKFNTWFLSAGICCIMMMGCNQPQKQESNSTGKTDDIVWKASLSYCLTNEKLEWQSLKQGLEFEDWEMYNFKVTEEQGKFKDLMHLFYDSVISKTYPLYSVDPVNGLFPGVLNTQQEKQNLLTDSAWNKDHTKLLSTILAFNYFKGLNISHELLFDSKAGSLLSAITDVDPLISSPYANGYLINIGALKFSNRTIDSMGTDQPGLKAEIAWGREMLLPIIDSGTGLRLMLDEHWVKMDSLSKFTVNGVSSSSHPLYPVCVKNNFNKKLAEWIWMAAKKGQLQAYAYVGQDSIGQMIPTKDLRHLEMVYYTDTIIDENGNAKIVTPEPNSSILNGLKLKEEIAFHRSTFSFESKITYAGVLVECRNRKNGLAIHNTSKVLYWVKLN